MTALVVMLFVQAAPTKLALGNVNGVNVDAKVGEFYAEQLAQQLALQPDISVTTRDQIATIIGLERQKALYGCADEGACVAELSGALGVDGVVLGSVAKVGSAYTLNLKVIDARDGHALLVISERATSEDALIDLINASAVKLADRARAAFHPETAGRPATVATSLRGRSWMPLAAGGVLLVTGVVLYGLAKVNEGALRSKETMFTSVGQIDGAVSAGNAEQTAAFIAGGVGIAALLAGASMFVFGGSSAQATAALTPQGAVFAIGARW